jgi:hypothetical protein
MDDVRIEACPLVKSNPIGHGNRPFPTCTLGYTPADLPLGPFDFPSPMCEVDDVLRQIMAIRARTMEGLRLKVRVTEAASFDPGDGTIAP